MMDTLALKTKLPHLFASLLVFGGTPLITGFLLAIPTGNLNIMLDIGILFGIGWLALAPFLIRYGKNTIEKFPSDVAHLTKNCKDDFNAIYSKFSGKAFYSKKHLIFGLPFAIGADYIILKLFESAHYLMKIWLVCTMSLLFVLAGMGFWGIYLVIKLATTITSLPLKVDPFHPDGFGGLSTLSSFCIKGTMLFSSGSLLFLIAFEALTTLAKSNVTSSIAVVLTGGYVFLILVSFIIPAFALTTIETRLHEVLNNYLDKMNNESGIKLFVLQDTYAKMNKMKVWAFDFKIFLQLIGSLVLPIFIATVELLR